MFDLAAINAWMTARHHPNPNPGTFALTAEPKPRNAQEVFGERRASLGDAIRSAISVTSTDAGAGGQRQRCALPGSRTWFRHRRGLPPLQTSHSSYPPGSIGDGYERALKLRADARHERPRASPGPESSIVATTGRAPGSTLSRSSGTA